jgi:hypothetical protein
MHFMPVPMVAGEADPLTIIVSAGSAAITLLLGIVVALVSSRAKHVEESVKALDVTVNVLYRNVTALETWSKSATQEILRIKEGTLSLQVFQQATTDQNRRLEELKDQNESLRDELRGIDQALGSRPTRSEINIPAARPLARPTDERRDPTDPPAPYRPRHPSGTRRPGE